MSPIATVSNRIEAIDVLRGFSLLGIALVHMVEQYYAGPTPDGVVKTMSNEVLDSLAQGFVGFFIIGKFYMIFSFLFGLSFYMQFEKKDKTNSFIARYAWRLLILLVIGVVHHLHYRGDILSIYAIIGFGMFLFYRLPDKALLIIALILILNIPSLVVRSVALFIPGDANPFNFTQEGLLAYYNTIKSGTYLEILKANWNSFIFKMDFQVTSGRLYITLGLFLLGMYAGRKKVFENLSTNIQVFRRLIRYALYTMGGVIVFAVGLFGILFLLKVDITQEIGWLVGGLSFDLFNSCLAVIYVSWIVILYQKEKWQKRLVIFYPVGRMGLTTYLMQTLFGTLIFFSFGLGLIYDLGAFICLLIGAAIFVFQIAFASWWFRHFTYGPVEWVWRALTYFKAPRFTLPSTAHVVAE
jgi:uncharacterized protein